MSGSVQTPLQTSTTLEELKTQLLAEVRRSPAPTRRGHQLREAVVLFAVLAMYLGSYLLVGGYHAQSDRPTSFMVVTTLGFLLATLAAIWGVFGDRKSMTGPPLSWMIAVVVGVPLMQLGWVALGNELFPHSHRACTGRVGNVCLDFSLTLGSMPLLMLAAWRRRANVVHPGWAGATLGTAVGAAVGILIHLSCECTGLMHVLRGHILPVVLLAAFGAFAGLRMRRLSPN